MQVLWGSMSTGAKEDESSTGHVWAAGFHHITSRSRLARVLKLMNRLFLFFSKFFSGRGELRIMNQWIREHICVTFFDIFKKSPYSISIHAANENKTPHSSCTGSESHC
jgi:hypothetical protein